MGTLAVQEDVPCRSEIVVFSLFLTGVTASFASPTRSWTGPR